MTQRVDEDFAEHFENRERQEHAAHLGMWLFLTSEVLLFGALFGLYTGYRLEYSAEFAQAVHHNDIVIGTLNTAVLVTSSFSAAWAVHCAGLGSRRGIVGSLLVTLVLGLVFLAFKSHEYAAHFSEGIFPGALYHSTELPGPGANTFFTLYFFITGLHALHVVGGLSALLVVTILALRGRYSPERHTSLELSVLYWHLVDVIWIFVWPLMYLQK
jgi:cytochrome c oxidase subunit 3